MTINTVFTFNIASDIEINANEIAEMIAIQFEDRISNVEIVNAEIKIAKITKGEMIYNAIVRESQKPIDENVLTRQEMADEINCVVGRIAEIIRDNANDENVINYVNRVKNDRKKISTMKQMQKLQMQIAEFNDMTSILEKSIENVENSNS